VELMANGTAMVSSTVNLSNPGYFAISDLSVGIQVRSATGALIGVGGASAVTIPARGTGSISVSLWIPLGGSTNSLVTQDAQLAYQIWINASDASLFTLHISSLSNDTWNAPMSGLNATAGAPVVNPNGTVSVPVTLSFANHAGFTDVGTATFTILSASGATCGGGSLAVNAPGGSNFDQTTSVLLAAGCNPSGGHTEATYTGNGFTVTLPSESIP
jgi:hypothetical protein